MSGKGVDERVLSMKFDNASFEKNAKVTINTLDKLQRTWIPQNCPKIYPIYILM